MVIKPNIGSLPPRQTFLIGDTIDMRVAKAVVEYVATKSRAGRITACLKNYVGTGPRIVYAAPGAFSNGGLHNNHSLEGRSDSFIVDLAGSKSTGDKIASATLQRREWRGECRGIRAGGWPAPLARRRC